MAGGGERGGESRASRLKARVARVGTDEPEHPVATADEVGGDERCTALVVQRDGGGSGPRVVGEDEWNAGLLKHGQKLVADAAGD